MTMLPRSLTLRLVILFMLLISSLLIGLAWLVLSSTDRHFLELDEIYLRDKARLLQEIALQAVNLDDLDERLYVATNNSSQGEQTDSDSGELRVWLFDPANQHYRSSGSVLSLEAADHLLNPQRHGQSASALASQFTFGQPSVTVQAILTLTTDHHDHYMNSFHMLIWGYVALAIGTGGLLGWWVARKGLEPLRPIIAKTSHIDASQLNDRIPVAHMPIELQPLAHTLNQMLQRLEADFTRLSDFASDLAHELRTPISNMLVQAQVTLSKQRDASQYRDALCSTVEELERLSSMVSDMLYLAKTEHQIEVPRPDDVDLTEQAMQLAEFYGLTAEDRDIKITVSGTGVVRGDRSMIRRAISNLLSNAIRHATEQSTVQIEIAEREASITLAVTNTGPTLSAEAQARLFDRFFRVDQARAHPGSEGAGLGLAITRAVMKVHQGSIEVCSTDQGVRFTLVFQVIADSNSTREHDPQWIVNAR